MNLKQVRSFLCNLIGGTLPIREETGRFSNEAREDRWCRLCSNYSEIEDTIHFLAICPQLSEVPAVGYGTSFSSSKHLAVCLAAAGVLDELVAMRLRAFYKVRCDIGE